MAAHSRQRGQDGQALTCHLGDIITWHEAGAQWRGCVCDLWTDQSRGEPCATVQTAFGLRDVRLQRDQPALVKPAAARAARKVA